MLLHRQYELTNRRAELLLSYAPENPKVVEISSQQKGVKFEIEELRRAKRQTQAKIVAIEARLHALDL